MTAETVVIGRRRIGPGEPTYVIAEIGINHNGDLDVARQLIDIAVAAGCDAVKFQKRTPDVCVRPEQRDILRETPWGLITYLDYRNRIEFGPNDYRELDRYCTERAIDWFVSCWDIESVDVMEQFAPVCYKVPSAAITDRGLLRRLADTGRTLIMSTGMSTIEEIRGAVSVLPPERTLLAHSTSTYPCPPAELNLRMIQTLKREFGCLVGYSGHEVGLQTTVAAVALGAEFIERHITLDRAMWGTDQAASIEPGGLIRLVRDIRVVEQALGDGVKRLYESEKPVRDRLRR
jgi:N-acetylneuraminate synthase